MRSKIIPPINPNPEIEQMLHLAYEEVFSDLASSTKEVVELAAGKLIILGVLDYKMSDRVDPRADFIGKADKSWPAVIKERLDNYNESLDIVPARLKTLGEKILELDSKTVKNVPILTGTKDFNLTPSDMPDIDYVKMILDRDIHPQLPNAIGQTATKVA